MLLQARQLVSLRPACRLHSTAVLPQPTPGQPTRPTSARPELTSKQEDKTDVLLVTVSFLLADARASEETFELLNAEGAFPRLVDLIAEPRELHEEGLHRLLMELLYEMSRIQKISLDNLSHVTDDFIIRLFDIIEQVSGDVADPYHYPVIRVLLVFNEQFMVAAHDPDHAKRTTPLTNKVVKVMSLHGSQYKTFGENIILLLNREDETSLQLLTLKLLYLLFTTPPTYEYFYTNDLRVLVDILMRNVLDLPEEAAALRHTYLRVLYPLLEHTQLQHPPHYKQMELQNLLTVLGGGRRSDQTEDDASPTHYTHFGAVDETTKRLVRRCRNVDWLADPDDEMLEQSESPTDERRSEPSSPISPSKPPRPALPAPRKLKKRESSKASTLTIGQFLAPQLEGARKSSLSMLEVAAQRERPGVITPSRNPILKHGSREATLQNRARPPLPQARRSAWKRMGMERSTTEVAVSQVQLNETKTSPTEEQKSELQDGEVEAYLPEEIRPLAQAKTPSPAETTAKPAALPPPPLPLVSRPSKKPPVVPKARRWRGKRSSHGEIGGREPGKFDARLPSLKPFQGQISKTSPVLPLAEKTLEPNSQTAGESQGMSSVSEALGQAQRQAIDSISGALDKATMEDEPPPIPPKPESPTQQKNVDQVPQTANPNIPTLEFTPPPQIVLAPPDHPQRGVPGPKFELEKSPFLSEDEEEAAEKEKEDDREDWEKDSDSDEFVEAEEERKMT